MNVQIVESVYYGIQDVGDVNNKDFLKKKNPLYIGAREGQVVRMRKLLDDNDKKGFALGVWELGELGYLNTDGSLNKNLFKLHDEVYCARSERVHEQFRPAYERLVEALRNV